MGWIWETSELNKFRKLSFLLELEAITHYMLVPYAVIQQTGEHF